MELDPTEMKLGKAWFFTAGALAFIFILILARVDLHLTYTDKEIKKAAIMNELRVAQTTIPSVLHDVRTSLDH